MLTIEPLVSIITVVRNDEHYIQRCIDSVFNQKYKSIEHIIIDGKSTDGTIEIIERNKDKLSFWLSEPDEGIYDAMNKAVKYAKGKWILFLGSDDILLEGFSEMAKRLTNKNTFYYGRVIYQGRIHHGEYDKYSLAHNNICHHAIFYPKIVFKKYHYDVNYKIYADYILNLKCWKDKEIPFQYYDIVISEFNHTGVSATTPDPLFTKNRLMLIKEQLGLKVYTHYKWFLFKEKMIAKYYRRKNKIKKIFVTK